MEETKNVFKSIIASVQKEFDGFESDTLRLSKREIFLKHWEITFYTEMHSYIYECLENDFDEEEVEILHGMSDILYQAYQTFEDSAFGDDPYSISTFGDDRKLIEGLIKELKGSDDNE